MKEKANFERQTVVKAERIVRLQHNIGYLNDRFINGLSIETIDMTKENVRAFQSTIDSESDDEDGEDNDDAPIEHDEHSHEISNIVEMDFTFSGNYKFMSDVSERILIKYGLSD